MLCLRRVVNRRIYTNLGSSGTLLQLFVNKLAKEDSGSYSCVANYGADSLRSSVIVEPYREYFVFDFEMILK